MKRVLLYILLVLAAFSESVGIPLHLTLIVAFLWLLFYDEPEGLFAAFLGGLIIDIYSFSPFGLHSLSFVLLSFGLSIWIRAYWYSKERSISFLLYFALALFLEPTVLLILQYHVFVLGEPVLVLLADIAVSFIGAKLFRHFIGPKQAAPIKLRLS